MPEEDVANAEAPVFSLPEELLAKLTARQGQERMPSVVQIQVPFDHTPLAAAANTETTVEVGPSGPMVVRRRNTKTTLFRADGREAVVSTTQKPRLLNKRDKNGKQVFFEKPPMKVPANSAICRYCFKKFRPSTAWEIASNASKPSLDDEAMKLLAEQYPDMSDRTSMSVNDVQFKLAEHVRVRHGRLAAFTGDPLFKRIQGSGSEVANQELSAFAPDQPKRGRGRPRKNV